MMWDLSGGRRSPLRSTTGPPPFPTPQHFAPAPSPAPLAPGRPASNAATYGSSHAPTLSPGYSIGQAPSTSRSDSFGQVYDHRSHQSYDQYQIARGVPFPVASSYGQLSPSQHPSQPTIVVHHSKHHLKSKHSSHNRLRRHSHSGNLGKPPAPQVPIYTPGSGSGTHLKPALVHHATSSHNLNSSYHTGQHPSHNHSHNHVAFLAPSASSSKPKPSKSHSHSHSHAQSSSLPHYSKCNRKKKALCIGINYTGQRNELRGCVNDARRVREFLIKNRYAPENVVLLTDDAKDPRALPTRKNIIACMKWLVKGADHHDALFFHYSGHGGQTPDTNNDELDGYDEVIYPLDFKKNGHITDDEMHEIMVRPLPDDCRLTGLFDACHSGTVLDLPYIYSSHGRLKGSHITDQARRSKATNADVISWSGCKDGQTSADTFHGGVAVGAMSHAFITSLSANPNQTYQELLRSIRLILHPRYSQRPQLGSSHHIDTNLKFVF